MSQCSAWLNGVCLALGVLVAGAGAARADEALDKALADPNDWASDGHGLDNTRFSPLKQIDTKNVGNLRLARAFQLAALRANESSPPVIGETLYVAVVVGRTASIPAFLGKVGEQMTAATPQGGALTVFSE